MLDMNKIKFTLENLTYDLVVNSSDELQFILPHKLPNISVKEKTKM